MTEAVTRTRPSSFRDADIHSRRVVLIGDAAHASSPMMGQGGCMAIEDACTLADALDTEPSIEHALTAYTSLRRPRNRWVAEQSQAVAESLRLSPAVRDSVLRERGRAMFQHRFSPLTSDPKLDSSLLG